MVDDRQIRINPVPQSLTYRTHGILSLHLTERLLHLISLEVRRDDLFRREPVSVVKSRNLQSERRSLPSSSVSRDHPLLPLDGIADGMAMRPSSSLSLAILPAAGLSVASMRSKSLDPLSSLLLDGSSVATMSPFLPNSLPFHPL